MIGKDNLCHLIYFSRNTLPGNATARANQLAQIVRAGQKKNEFSVITSFLISERDWFMQVVEGERMAVYETFQRISTDSRHRDVRISEWREIPRRDFILSLGSAVRGPDNEAIFAKYNVSEALDRGTPKPSLIRGLAMALQADSIARKGIEQLLV